MASVAQSAIFNHWLGARVLRGELDSALTGDVLKKRETGGLFDCEDPIIDGPRVTEGEVDPTGPMLGRKMRATSSIAGDYESSAAAEFGLDEGQLKTLLRWSNGTRRVARIVPQDLQLEISGAVLEAHFFLRKGCFATVVLAELVHPPTGDLRR
jgi:tRNA pseudouridine13 synthase